MQSVTTIQSNKSCRRVQHVGKRTDLVVVGEAPGETEIRLGKPFVGYEGKYLQQLFKSAGYDLFDFTVTNTVHVRPPNNVYERLSPGEIEEGRQALQEDLAKWRPNCVLAVGGKALKVLTSLDKITVYRGAVLWSDVFQVKVVPILHPGGILRGGDAMAKYEPVTIMDIRKAVREAGYRDVVYPDINVTVIDNADEAISLIEGLKDVTVVDIETAGNVLTAFGVAVSETQAYSITSRPLMNVNVLRAISRFMASDVPKVFHNALYDCFFLAYYYRILTRNIYYDTMIAQHACYPTLPKSLAFCASIYTNMPYWKDTASVDLYHYNGVDCCLTYLVMNKTKHEMEQLGVRECFNLMMSLVEPSLFAMLRGVAVDLKALEKFKDRNEAAIKALERALDLGVNWKSPKQVAKLLYEDWGLPNKKTVDRKTLKALERYPTPYRPLIGAISALRQLYKLREFYDLTTDPDGRVRYAIHITGTYTGRLASTKSITGSGRNFFNIPKECRSFYVPDEGRVFLEADLSQAEARVVAALVGDLDWLRAFDEKDQHRYNASLIFNVPYDEVTDEQRSIAKKISHATNYGMGKQLMSLLIGVPPKEAQALMDAYKSTKPKLVAYHQYVERLFEEKRVRVVRTPFGRFIPFFGPKSASLVRDYIAAYPQSVVADCMSRVVRAVYDKTDANFVLTLYDAILVEADPSEVLHVMQVIKEHAEQPIRVGEVNLVIPVEFEVGLSFGAMKKVTMESVEDVLMQLCGRL